MRIGEAKELFRQLTKTYFSGASVIFSNQQRSAKPDIPLVVISPGNVRRPHTPNSIYQDGYNLAHYHTRLSLTVDLFTNGAPIVQDGYIMAYENNAMEDVLAYIDFLNSDYAISWCHDNDVSILIDGEAMDLTGIVNDTSYEFRARISVYFYFTQVAIGKAAVFDEGSIKYPTGETDPETGDPIFGTDPPEPDVDIFPGGNVSGGGFGEGTDNEGGSGGNDSGSSGDGSEEPPDGSGTTNPDDGFVDKNQESIDNAVIQPEFNPTESGGGSDELADEDVGYFTDVEIKEEKLNE